MSYRLTPRDAVLAIISQDAPGYSNWLLYGRAVRDLMPKIVFCLMDSSETQSTILTAVAFEDRYFRQNARAAANTLLGAATPPGMPSRTFNAVQNTGAEALRGFMMQAGFPFAMAAVLTPLPPDEDKPFGVFYCNQLAYPARPAFGLLKEMLRDDFEKLP
jgi:hypothetical protein